MPAKSLLFSISYIKRYIVGYGVSEAPTLTLTLSESPPRSLFFNL